MEVHGVDRDRLAFQRALASGGSMAFKSLEAVRIGMRVGLPMWHLRRFVRLSLWYARVGATWLNHRLVASRTVASLPRALVYVPMRSLIYAEFLATRVVRVIYRFAGRPVEPRNLFNDYKFPKPITDDTFKSDRKIDRSIRTIVKNRRSNMSVPISPTDRNQRILVQGR